jgi:glycosyltransferase involved in cell wall biosynthesis
MKAVMTLLVRDEADIVDSMLSFHLNAGVDFVIAMDNGSVDGTTEILESYAADGVLHLLRQPEVDHYFAQGEWVTQMARLAATEFGADWIIHADADEFWWPRSGSLKEIFGAIPAQFGRVHAMVRHFVPRPETGDLFAERMTARVCNPGFEMNNPFGPRSLIAHRADPEITLNDGRRATQTSLRALSGWYPIDMLHFPIRSLRQCELKYRLRWMRMFAIGEPLPGVYRLAYEANRKGRFEEFYKRFLVDDAALVQGLAQGTLAIDNRLRDALRAIREGKPEAIRFEDVIAEDYLSELGRLAEAQLDVLTQRRVEELELRIGTAERSLSSRLFRAF